ncbi:hypothetical protein B0H16DRAFT_921639 [Mycena metata]|uniref:Uncharacterized protein n=1 Tax=Mycena metata TaxID=1033252 RepID=A0AAD7IP41_9AGAR|nr:hypothetical protein B0H16DRAFT_921639 [Mycena metata]
MIQRLCPGIWAQGARRESAADYEQCCGELHSVDNTKLSAGSSRRGLEIFLLLPLSTLVFALVFALASRLFRAFIMSPTESRSIGVLPLRPRPIPLVLRVVLSRPTAVLVLLPRRVFLAPTRRRVLIGFFFLRRLVLYRATDAPSVSLHRALGCMRHRL